MSAGGQGGVASARPPAAGPAAGLLARDISVSRGRKPVLRGVSLHLRPGELVALLGANGAGKSTLMAALAGELPVHAGAVALDGRPLGEVSAAAQARRRAVLPQSASLTFDLEVDELVAMGAYPHPGLAPAEVQALAARALDLADAAALRGRRYRELSGGEQQRVQLARVLVQCLGARAPGQARYLLLDEPTASLDPRHQHGLLRAAAGLARSDEVGVLAILHDVNLAARWCDRLVLLADGGVAADGPPDAVLDAQLLQRVYGASVTLLPHPRLPGRPLVLFE